MFQDMPKLNIGGDIEKGNFALFNSKKYIKFRPQEITYNDFKDEPLKLFELGGRDLYIRPNLSVSSGVVELYSIQDNNTESIQYIGNSLNNYPDTYKIIDVKRINRYAAWIITQYQYDTYSSQPRFYPYSIHYIWITKTGKFNKANSTYYNGTTITALQNPYYYPEVKPIVIPSLYGNRKSMNVLMGYTKKDTSNNFGFYVTEYSVYEGSGFARGASSGGWNLNYDTVNANYYVPDPTIINAKGGLFWKVGAADSSNYVTMGFGCSGGYGSGNYKQTTLANADSTGKLASLGVTNHYVVGMTSDDIVVTVQIDMSNPVKYVYHFYLWLMYFGPTYTSDADWLVPYEISDSVIEKPAGTKLLYFTNDVITFSDLTRYQVRATDRTISKIASISQEVPFHGVYSTPDEIGPESDPFFGVYIWGD